MMAKKPSRQAAEAVRQPITQSYDPAIRPHGIVITPYIWERRTGETLRNIWYYGWDCAALAIAHADGQIFILSRRNGERWSRSIPEITHAFYRSKEDVDYDVKGARTVGQMAADFGIEAGKYELLGPFTSADFRRKFMGNSDRHPLFGGAAEVKEAVAIIRAQPHRYGIH